MGKMKVKIRIEGSGLVYCDAFSDEYILCNGWECRGTRCDGCPLERIKECLRG